MNDERSQLVMDELASVDPREGDLTAVKRRGRRLKRGRHSTYAFVGFVAVLGVLGSALLQPSSTAFAVEDYTASQREMLVSCFVDFGFEATAQPDGSVLVTHGDADRESIDRAAGICIDVVDGRATATEEEIRGDYEYRLKQRDCLIAAGYSVAEPPSWEMYLDQYGDGNHDNDWFPVEHVTENASIAELSGVLDDCGLSVDE